MPMNEPDEGMNLAVFNTEGLSLKKYQTEALRSSYQPERLSQFHRLYDQLVSALTLGNGSGGWCILESEKSQGATVPIRKVLILLILPPHNHFMH
jgi:hypothetical protein